MSDIGKRQELEHQSRLAYYNAVEASKLELLRTVNQAGQTALRSCIFLNAGSAVALLAFIANVWDKTELDVGLKIVIAVSLFGFGAMLGCVSTGFTYLAQYAFDMNRDKLGHSLNVAANGLVFVSYNLFLIGGYVTLMGIGKKFGVALDSASLIRILLIIILILVNVGLGILTYKVLKRESKPSEGQ